MYYLYCKSLLSPITQNPDFPAGVGSSVFSSWWNTGIRTIGDLIKDNILMSFQQQATFNIPQQHFFAYLQLRHFMGMQKDIYILEPYFFGNRWDFHIKNKERSRCFPSGLYL